MFTQTSRRQLFRGFSSINTQVCIVGAGPVGMVLSKMLTNLGVDNVIIERQKQLQNHPKAHYLGFRTCEILSDLGLHSELSSQLDHIDDWKQFVYTKHVLSDTPIACIPHFSGLDDIQKFQKEFTYAFPCHYSQNKLVANLCRMINPNQIHFNTNYISHKYQDNNQIQIQTDSSTITCDALVGTDGVRSAVRQSIGIDLQGQKDLANFINIHFTSAKLAERLRKEEKSAMLHFIFNASNVSVLVTHDLDPLNSSFVLQVPYFPPVESQGDYGTARCTQIVLDALQDKQQSSRLDQDDIEVVSVNSWKMDAVVAKQMVNQENNIFLAGDAAHAFPPSGGFGLNTGIADAYSLAHTIAPRINSKAGWDEAAQAYNNERREVAKLMKEFSLINYEKSLKVARMLGLQPSHAKAFTSIVQTAIPSSLQQGFLSAGMGFGLQMASMLPTDRLKKFLLATPDNSIKLLFPNLDFNLSSDKPDTEFLKKHFDDGPVFTRQSVLKKGSLIPHLRIEDKEGCQSIRQFISQKQYSLGHSCTIKLRISFGNQIKLVFETVEGQETEAQIKVNSDDLNAFKRMLPEESTTVQLRGDGVVSEIIGFGSQEQRDDFNAIEGLKTTYKITKEGHGAAIEKRDTITVHATGIVQQTGLKFWSTKDPGQTPFTYQAGVGGVITGWDQGLLGAKEGEHRTLKIVSNEGYGPSGFPSWGIPANGDLIFEIEVLKVQGK